MLSSWGGAIEALPLIRSSRASIGDFFWAKP
jgi:hypothetical protein